MKSASSRRSWPTGRSAIRARSGRTPQEDSTLDYAGPRSTPTSSSITHKLRTGAVLALYFLVQLRHEWPPGSIGVLSGCTVNRPQAKSANAGRIYGLSLLLLYT